MKTSICKTVQGEYLLSLAITEEIIEQKTSLKNEKFYAQETKAILKWENVFNKMSNLIYFLHKELTQTDKKSTRT